MQSLVFSSFRETCKGVKVIVTVRRISPRYSEMQKLRLGFSIESTGDQTT